MSWIEDGMHDAAQRTAEFLALAVENAELCQQLADVHGQCVELAVDADEQHAENEALRARLAQAEKARDARRAKAKGSQRTG
ncbi:hypothetical protein [Methylobacterium sp. V23]|uniref:hypothetical protein n=1 Tax=Methylobacterium sp. V23 TaxID=2044878 RepID=UPI001FE1F552|nr:hypothetical protein [Methylobacterium sp. V23]